MTETLAKLIAEELAGTAFDTGGNIWCVRFDHEDGPFAVLSLGGAGLYTDAEAFELGSATEFVSFN